MRDKRDVCEVPAALSLTIGDQIIQSGDVEVLQGKIIANNQTGLL